MVLTRRQEQLMHTPPLAGASSGAQPSPATPVTQAAEPEDEQQQGYGRAAPLPLKSALKTRLRQAGSEEHGTPVGAGIKKRVRIHSSSNLVHEFQTSLTTEELLASEGRSGSDDDEDEEDTPQSGGRSGRRRARHSARKPSPISFSLLSLLVGGSPRRGRRGSGGRRRSSRGASAAWLGLAFTLCWMGASSALIFANKALMVDHGFRFPFALTALGQLSSMLLAWAATVLGVAPLRSPPSPGAAITRLLPVSFSFAASLFLGNYSYLGLSVAFINMLKAATPLVTLAVGLAARLERLSKLTLLATALIAFGTAVATASEAATGHFRWLAFVAFAFSVVFEGVRVVLTEKLLGQAKYNVMEALVYLGPFTTAFLAGGAYLFEWDAGLSTEGWAVLQSCADQFATALTLSFLVNLFCYLSIKHVSATSFKVAGCLKNVIVVWGGILQGDKVSERELQGYAISLGGFVLFSFARMRRPAGAEHGSSPHRKRR